MMAVLFLGILSGCLDIPSSPNTGKKIERVSIYVSQTGIEDSTVLKINPGDSAVLNVDVYPRQYKKELSFEWYGSSIVQGDSEKTLLAIGDQYTLLANVSEVHIPEALKVTDPQGYTLWLDFEIITNTPPKMDSVTVPAPGDTLYGNSSTVQLFKWSATDEDLANGDELRYTLVIDSKSYNLGSITSVYQSGFTEGAHTFQVIVTDSHGDGDTLPSRTFYVEEPLEDGK